MEIAHAQGAKFVYWCQDFYSIAVESYLRTKSTVFGSFVGAVLRRIDEAHMRKSDHIIHITGAFKSITDEWGICDSLISIIPNWGAIAEIPVRKKDNHWAQKNGLKPNASIVMYSGTLGLKHNPDLLLSAAQAMPECEFVVVGSGVGFDRLDSQALKNLTTLPLQTFGVYAEVLGSADVLVGMIEPDAGRFSVPSKILSYLCACRPIVLSAPLDNLAATIIDSEKAGMIVEPGATQDFISSLKLLLSDSAMARSMGERGRAYAENNFDITEVGSKFEALLRNVVVSS